VVDTSRSLGPWAAAIVLAMGPVLPYAIRAPWSDGVGICVELVVAWVFLHRLGTRWRWGLALLWSVLVCFALARAASRVASDSVLPLADLTLLIRPLLVVTRDLYGPAVAYGALAAAALVPVALLGVGRGLWAVADRGREPPAGAVAVALALLLAPGSRSVTGELLVDAWASGQMAAAFHAEVARRDTLALAERTAVRHPDIEVMVVESYGMVTAELPSAPRWRATLAQLQAATDQAGWATVSGRSVAPVHGSRSWIADSSVFTGLHIAHQADFERVIRRTERMVTLPSWFAARGWSTLLVRPADRARPGVHLQNHFDFQHTTFFADLDYRGPSVGWGYVPDQFSLHRVRHEVVPRLSSPRLAFVHLATSHVPWQGAPPLFDDPLQWQQRAGERQWKAPTPTPWQALRLVARRFRDSHRDPADVDRIEGWYVDTVDYSLRAVAGALPDPTARPALVVVMGDHQPPFLAPDRPPEVPVHVLASDPSLLAPFRDAGFTPGWEPGPGTVAHHDLLPLLVEVVSAP